MEHFFPPVSSHIVPQGVTSEPLPAVVGIAINGTGFKSSGFFPASRRCERNQDRGCWVPRTTASALAESITLPPPNATTVLKEMDAVARARFSMDAMVGLGRTASETPAK